MRSIRPFAVFVVCASVACGSVRKHAKAYVPDGVDARHDVTIWVEPDARLPKETVFKGCEIWKVRNVFCVEVATADSADIRVYAFDGRCVLNDDNGTPGDRKDDRPYTALGLAYVNGDIKMMMGCLTSVDGVYDSRQMTVVASHEIGHQLGIRKHVPYAPECKDALTHPSGRKVCGPAVMNKYHDPDIDYVTEIDSLAFDLREPKNSVLASAGPEDADPICAYGLEGDRR